MPQQFIFHEAHALPFHRMRHHARWLPRLHRHAPQRLLGLLYVVPIDFPHPPSERAPLGRPAVQVKPFRHRPHALILPLPNAHSQLIPPLPPPHPPPPPPRPPS